MDYFTYQYETSPRKIKTDYMPLNKKKKKVSNKTNEKIQVKNLDSKEEKLKRKKRNRIYLFIKILMMFVILFLMILGNSQMNEAFAKIQKYKSKITAIQKENNQLEVNIQNSLNLNNVEQSAKELLGMQKLSNKQIVYISIPKIDYVESSTEKINILEEEESLIQKIEYFLKNIF